MQEKEEQGGGGETVGETCMEPREEVRGETTRMRSYSHCPSTWTPHTCTATDNLTHSSPISPFTDSSACDYSFEPAFVHKRSDTECAA